MKPSSLLMSSVLMVLLACHGSHGHGIPILIDLVESAGQWTTDHAVYTTSIESIGDQVLLTDIPGYRVAEGGRVPAGTEFSLGSAGSLLYWSPQSSAVEPTSSILTVANPEGALLSVQQCGPAQTPGISFGPYTGSPDWHRHVDYLLDPLSSAAGAYAVPLTLSAEPMAASAPFLLVFGLYGPGFTESMMSEAVAALQQASYVRGGDFDHDCTLTVHDIDLLSEAVRQVAYSSQFDLSNDGQLSNADRQVWVEQLAFTYFGDANLDGQFNSGDLVLVLQAGEYEDSLIGNSTWATGDWNGDAEFDSADLVEAFQTGAYETGPRPAAPGQTQAVPEPSALALLTGALAALGAAARTPRIRRLATGDIGAV